MTMKPCWFASEANSVPEKNTGPEPVQKWTATRTAGCGFTVSGTYRNIRRPLGLRPKLVTSASDAALAARGAAQIARTAPRTTIEIARASLFDIPACSFRLRNSVSYTHLTLPTSDLV